MNTKFKSTSITTDADRIDAIRSKKSDFARSLVSQFDRKGYLSEKQWSVVDRILTSADVKLFNIMQLFVQARSAGLKKPAFRFAGFKFSMAPDNGVNRNHVYVKSIENGGHYAGKITPEGDFRGGHEYKGQLAEIGRTPADELKVKMIEEGRATGCCCFCAKTLKTKASLKVGYGPVCADNYGLPWGL